MILSLFLTLVLSQSNVPPPPTDFQSACANEISTLNCSASQDEQTAMTCIKQYWPNISPSCEDYIRSHSGDQRNDTQTSPSCDADVALYCANSQGFTSTLKCLRENSQQLSPLCHRILRPERSERPDGHRGRDHEDHEDHEGREGRDRDNERQRAMERLNATCANDAAKWCPRAEGIRSTMKCLRHNKDQLTEACAMTVETMSEDDHKKKGVHVIVGLVVLALGICVVVRLVRRCRRRRMRYYEQQSQQMVVVPGMMPMMPSSSPQSAAPIAMAAVPPPHLVYSAGPSYTGTGGMPMSMPMPMPMPMQQHRVNEL